MQPTTLSPMPTLRIANIRRDAHGFYLADLSIGASTVTADNALGSWTVLVDERASHADHKALRRDLLPWVAQAVQRRVVAAARDGHRGAAAPDVGSERAVQESRRRAAAPPSSP